jgi:PAS domain S-box-containing protein
MNLNNARKLLQKQLSKHGLSVETPPTDLRIWREFLARIEKTYTENETARLSAEHVLDVSISEMEKMASDLLQADRQRLSELNEHLTLLLDASELGTWEWNPQDDSVSFNARWCEMIGLCPDSTPRSFDTFVSRVHPDDLDHVMTLARNYIQRKSARFEARFRMKHSAGHWVNIVARGKVTRFDSSGRPLRFTGTHLDVSEEVRMHGELESQKLKLNHSSRLAALGEMSAGIAHEINNPLAVINGYLSLIPRYLNNGEKILEITGNLQRASHRMQKIVGGLKKFSRTGSALNFSSHPLCDIIKESLALTEAKSKFSGVPVGFECESDSSILCDEIEVEQVIVNLVNNAIDAVKGLPEKWVKVRIFEEEGAVLLRVEDSGAGIPVEVEAKMFEPFFTTKSVSEGTGLGLSITKGILTEHNASIGIRRDLPNTCLEIRFPMTGSC